MDPTYTPSYGYEDHSHIRLYAALFLSIGSLIFLAITLANILMYRPTATSTLSQTEQQSVVPMLIQSKQQLNQALQQYDNSTGTANVVNKGLNQNSQDAAQFSQ